MSQHARPHLQTHTRGDGHSAVAGAAYRLGLRLFDERTQTWHDFRKRELGEEIVRALTVAPEGAPSWALDPAELWNRVEAAERRKDSQVARDYRIPIPFGLTDLQAGDLAEELARYIADQLSTAVSLGLHRDAEIDAQGMPKPKDKQGFHAHLYFPTRELDCSAGSGAEGNSGFGAKLSMLSNKRTSSGIVEQLNAKWAELANQFSVAHDLPADYTHLSYERQGIPIMPQPTLGQAVTAMERKGFFTRKGDALREIVVMSEVYKQAHAAALEAQHQQAVADIEREVETAQSPHSIAPPSAGGEVADAPGSLAARFRAVAPSHAGASQTDTSSGVLVVVRVIERILNALDSLSRHITMLREALDRRMAAKLAAEYELDVSRVRRQEANTELKRWEAKHPLRVRINKTFGATKAEAWTRIIDAGERANHEVQSLKRAVKSHEQELDSLGNEVTVMQETHTKERDRLQESLQSLADYHPDATSTLVAVSMGHERGLLEDLLPRVTPYLAPPPVGGPKPDSAALELRPPDRRHRKFSGL